MQRIPERHSETLKLSQMFFTISVFSSLRLRFLWSQVQNRAFLHLAGGGTVVPSAESAFFALGR